MIKQMQVFEKDHPVFDDDRRKIDDAPPPTLFIIVGVCCGTNSDPKIPKIYHGNPKIRISRK